LHYLPGSNLQRIFNQLVKLAREHNPYANPGKEIPRFDKSQRASTKEDPRTKDGNIKQDPEPTSINMRPKRVPRDADNHDS